MLHFCLLIVMQTEIRVECAGIKKRRFGDEIWSEAQFLGDSGKSLLKDDTDD